ncbi:MAG TPA: aminotransferase class I/II-fold pyridoxal phosphate-dependent enzyme [Flavipsychrobacter sp.]|nr:aminotransferase class I/II-fold pyridoxal phosphate-dependent enzyme [Flavipsychrobacter sp.]
MGQLSLLAESLIGSEIVKLGNEISVRISKGEKIFNYTIGDFDPSLFPIPKELEDAIVTAYRQHFTNYPPGDGTQDLREAVIRFIKEFEGIEYTLDEVQIASGGRPVIYTVFRTLVDEDDKVVYAVPSWNNNHYTHMNWGKHCLVEALPENDFMPTANDLAPHVAGASLLCLCSPQNPTGTTFQKDELEKICDLVLEENRKRGDHGKKLYVMYDQMYWMLTYGDTKHYNPVSLRPEMKEYTVFVDGISKVFAATGVRVGWALGPAKVIGKIKAFLSHIGAWAPLAEQKATASFLTNKDAVVSYLEPFKQGLQLRLQKIYDGVMQLKGKGYPVDAIAPQAALYLTVKIDLSGKYAGEQFLETQADVTTYILSEAKLAIVPFSCFGAGDSPWYRISVGTCKPEELEEIFSGLERALAKVKAGAHQAIASTV